MPTGRASRRWQGFGPLARRALTIGVAGIAALLLLAPAQASAPGSHQRQALRPSQPLPLSSTPDPTAPQISLTPNIGPVGTTVTVQGSDWPAQSSVQFKYSATSCTSPDVQNIPNAPTATVDKAGSFSASFTWPAVSSTGIWYVCPVTSDGAASSSGAFNVQSTSAPTVNLTTKGPFTLGQRITVQGLNWLPGGLTIALSLQPVKGNTSFPLDQSPISLIGTGAIGPIIVTIPGYLLPGQYMLVASAENEALLAKTAPFEIDALPTPTPTPSPSPSPSPTPTAIITPTPLPIHPQKPPEHHIGGTLLALLVISGGMALAFALVGAALLIYLVRSRRQALAD